MRSTVAEVVALPVVLYGDHVTSAAAECHCKICSYFVSPDSLMLGGEYLVVSRCAAALHCSGIGHSTFASSEAGLMVLLWNSVIDSSTHDWELSDSKIKVYWG